MSQLKFKLKKYNEGGFLDFLKKNPFQANALFTSATNGLNSAIGPQSNPDFSNFSSEFRNNKNKKQGLDKGLDLASGAASFIPGVGGLASAGLQGFKALSDLTSADEDEFGVHKSGFLSALDPQSELRKDKERFKTSQLMSGIQANEATGALSREAVGGFRAAPYGRKGMKLRSKFSRAVPC